MPTTAERRLRQALADLIRVARTVENDALELAVARATKTLDECRTVAPVREPEGPRRLIGEHKPCGGGRIYDVQKGLTWALWCDRCGHLPRRWRVRRRVNPNPEVRCRDCLCFVPERNDCPAVGRYRAPDDEPFLTDCFIPLAESENGLTSPPAPDSTPSRPVKRRPSRRRPG